MPHPHLLLRDPIILVFIIAGGSLVALILCAVFIIAVPELANPIHLASIAGEREVIDSLFITFLAGFIAILIILLLGTPLSYVLARNDFSGKEVIEGLIDIPLILPHTVAGLMVYLLFMTRGIIGAPFQTIGFIFEDAFPGIIAAMVFVAIPYYVDGVREGFEMVPVRLEHVARTLGATRWKTFIWISLPLTSRHIVSSALIAWGRAIGEFAAVVMIAYFPMVVSSLIYLRFVTGGITESRSVAFIMLILCLGLFIGIKLITKRFGRYHDTA